MKAQPIGAKLVELPYLSQELTDTGKKVLIIGERIGNEGIIETVLEKTQDILCTDIVDMQPDSILHDIIKETPTVSFVKGDFLAFDESVKYDYIVCINVLEHFGMNFTKIPMFTDTTVAQPDHIIKWNYDMLALAKMICLLKQTGKIIITVPAGNPIMSGDCNPETTMPFLRRYDFFRIQKVKELLEKLQCDIKENFYYSDNFVDWMETTIEISHPQNTGRHNPFSPNVIWAFTINKR